MKGAIFAGGQPPSLTNFAAVPNRSILRRVTTFVRRALAVHAERKTLLVLTDAQLADIGISRADAVAEAGRSIWDTPGRLAG